MLVRSPGSGRVHALSRYHANWNRPRPESHGKVRPLLLAVWCHRKEAVPVVTTAHPKHSTYNGARSSSP